MDEIASSYTAHTLNILRVAAGMREAAVDALVDLEGHLVGKVATARTINNQARLTTLLAQTRASITATHKMIADGQIESLKGIAALEGRQAVNVVNGAIGVDVLTVSIPPKVLEAVVDRPIILGHTAKEWWSNQATSLQNAFAGQMQQGILAGETNEQLMRRVRGTKASGFEDGIMAANRRQAAALVRSSAISVSNQASLESFKELGDVVKGVQWLASLDGRTTAICRALSGLMWRLPDYEPIGHTHRFPGPTAHWGCRSRPIPVMRSWEELAGKPLPSVGDEELEARMRQKLAKMGMRPAQIDQATIRTQASMDGQVAADLDFEGWLQGKDDGFVNSVLGPGRAKLWNRGAGKISLTEMTDQNNRPLTIAQLENLIVNGRPVPETEGLTFFQLNPAGKYVVATASEAAAKAAAAAEEEAAAAIARAEAAAAAANREREQAILDRAQARAEAAAERAAAFRARAAEQAALRQAAAAQEAAQREAAARAAAEFRANQAAQRQAAAAQEAARRAAAAIDPEARQTVRAAARPAAKPRKKKLVKITEAFEKNIELDDFSATFLAKELPGLETGDLHKLTSGLPSEKVEFSVTKNGVRAGIFEPGVNISRRIVRSDVDGKLIIYNALQILRQTGTGRGIKAFAEQTATAKKVGIARLETDAAGSATEPYYNGYYTWPRFGYDAKLVGMEARKAQKALKLKKLPESVLDLMGTKEGRAWWKANGNGRKMYFDLKEGSRSWAVLNAYLTEKKL